MQTPNRAAVAGFLQGLFVLPLCVLFGGLTALLFHAHGLGLWACVGFCGLFPIFGAARTRQRALLAGLIAGVAITTGLFFALAPVHAQEQPLPLRGFIVCLDPGHASETSEGTVSRDGRLTELHVNWVVAQRLTRLLEADGATVVPTKLRESQIVTNRRRAEIANAAHANLFLRLHCDSGEQSGIATYYPNKQGMRFGVTGPSPGVIHASLIAASVFQPVVVKALHGTLRDAGIKGDSKTGVGSKQGALTGSIFSHVPALTVEMCVLTNAHDYAFIRSPDGQDQMARALLAGVTAYAAQEEKIKFAHKGVYSYRQADHSKERIMSLNITQESVGNLTAEQQQQHLKEVHEHLRHASTSDSAEEIRERLRRAEIALQRHEQQQSASRN